MGFLNELFSAGVWGKKTPTAPIWKNGHIRLTTPLGGK